MTLTRADTENILVSRRSGQMDAVEMAVTVAGANTDLNDAIGYGIRKADGTVSSFVLVADADFLTVDSEDYDKLLDYAELRLLYSIKGRWAKWSIKAGMLSEDFNQFADQVDKDIETLLQHITDNYGTAAELTAGTLELDFQADTDDTVYIDG